jgi:hypothetical protein
MTTTQLKPATPLDNQAILDQFAKFQDWRGATPFARASSLDASDRAAPYLSNARCILSVIAAALMDGRELSSKELDGNIQNVSQDILASALEGVGDLIDLASVLLVEGGN